MSILMKMNSKIFEIRLNMKPKSTILKLQKDCLKIIILKKRYNYWLKNH